MFSQAAWIMGASAVMFLGIFLGDARHHVVDVFAAAICIIGFFLVWRKRKFRSLPAPVVLLWAATFVVVGASLLWSDSPGASLQTLIRYLIGFIFFGLFYSITEEKIIDSVERVLVIGGVFASASSLVFLFIPRPPWLSSMNLLYLSHGHNHVADLLLFALPSALFVFRNRPTLGFAISSTVILGLVSSLSRGAWALSLAYGASVLGMGAHKQHKKILLVATALIALVLSGSIFLSRETQKNTIVRPLIERTIERYLTKGSLFQDPRLEYWRQALLAVRERPWFGGGAGTFYFASRRLQSRPDAYSWFAHSFPLQLLTELGLVGSLPILLLFLWVGRHLIRVLQKTHKHPSAITRLSWGATLTLTYSLIEFNLSFVVVWVFFWVVAGLVVATNQEIHTPKRNGRAFIVPLVILAGFYILLITQNFVYAFFPKRTDAAFFITPFDSTAAKTYLMTGRISPSGARLVTLFHRNDPETLSYLADAQEGTGDTASAQNVRERVIRLDPLTEEGHEKYVSLLLSKQDYTGVAQWVRRYARLYLPIQLPEEVFSLPPAFIREYASQIPNLFRHTWSHEVRYARLFYNVGLWYLSQNPVKTRVFWKSAGLLSPDLSHLWVERASLERHVFHNNDEADSLLGDCLENLFARTHCAKMQALEQLPNPGYFQREINEK